MKYTEKNVRQLYNPLFKSRNNYYYIIKISGNIIEYWYRKGNLPIKWAKNTKYDKTNIINFIDWLNVGHVQLIKLPEPLYEIY